MIHLRRHIRLGNDLKHSACGLTNLYMTDNPTIVTCKLCRRTVLFKDVIEDIPTSTFEVDLVLSYTLDEIAAMSAEEIDKLRKGWKAKHEQVHIED